jgi:hypothetical protein
MTRGAMMAEWYAEAVYRPRWQHQRHNSRYGGPQ